MTLHRKKITLTGASDTEYCDFFGVLEGFTIVNDGTATPSADWDLTVTETETGRAIWASTSVSETAITAVYPGVEIYNSTDSAAGTDFFTKHTCRGLTLVAANMGASKLAYVYVDWTEG